MSMEIWGDFKAKYETATTKADKSMVFYLMGVIQFCAKFKAFYEKGHSKVKIIIAESKHL